MLFIVPMYDAIASPLIPSVQGFFLGNVNVSIVIAVQKISNA